MYLESCTLGDSWTKPDCMCGHRRGATWGQPRFQKNMPESLGRHGGHADHRNLICLVGNIIVFHQGESHLTSYDKDSSMYYEESGMSFGDIL